MQIINSNISIKRDCDRPRGHADNHVISGPYSIVAARLTQDASAPSVVSLSLDYRARHTLAHTSARARASTNRGHKRTKLHGRAHTTLYICTQYTRYIHTQTSARTYTIYIQYVHTCKEASESAGARAHFWGAGGQATGLRTSRAVRGRGAARTPLPCPSLTPPHQPFGSAIAVPPPQPMYVYVYAAAVVVLLGSRGGGVDDDDDRDDVDAPAPPVGRALPSTRRRR